MSSENLHIILISRLKKLSSHFQALSEYHSLIQEILTDKNIYSSEVFKNLSIQEKAFLDAYLKRFSSMQDYLGAKVFSLLLEIAGIPNKSISEALSLVEKEGIIDDLSSWVELRQTRNELEHDYPEKLEDALKNLKFCINSFTRLKLYYDNTIAFSKKYIDAPF